MGDMSASGGGGKEHWNPLKNMKIAVYCGGVARNFEPEGNKGPRHFLVGDMGARGRGHKALAPYPPPEFENVLILVAYPGFLG